MVWHDAVQKNYDVKVGEQNEESILRQAKKRYLRLMIPTFLAFVINYILYHAGLLFNVQAGQALRQMQAEPP